MSGFGRFCVLCIDFCMCHLILYISNSLLGTSLYVGLCISYFLLYITFSKISFNFLYIGICISFDMSPCLLYVRYTFLCIRLHVVYIFVCHFLVSVP